MIHPLTPERQPDEDFASYQKRRLIAGLSARHVQIRRAEPVTLHLSPMNRAVRLAMRDIATDRITRIHQ